MTTSVSHGMCINIATRLVIFNSLSDSFNIIIDLHPLIALFGVRPGDCDWPLNMYNVLIFTSLANAKYY